MRPRQSDLYFRNLKDHETFDKVVRGFDHAIP